MKLIKVIYICNAIRTVFYCYKVLRLYSSPFIDGRRCGTIGRDCTLYILFTRMFYYEVQVGVWCRLLLLVPVSSSSAPGWTLSEAEVSVYIPRWLSSHFLLCLQSTKHTSGGSVGAILPPTYFWTESGMDRILAKLSHQQLYQKPVATHLGSVFGNWTP